MDDLHNNQQANSDADTAPAYRRAPHEKRASLIAAAKKLFIEQGFDATSTLQIARLANVSEGILFHHFGSKKGLFLAIADEVADLCPQ